MRARYPGLLAGALLMLPLLSFRTLVAQTQSTYRSVVDGIVVDKGKTPVPSAEVELRRQGEASRMARSDNDGRFSFPGVQTGPLALTVRRMGYVAKTINMDVPAAGTSPTLEVELEEIPSDISSVIVESSKEHLLEFYQRKGNNTFAKFFDSKDIQKRNPFYLSEMVSTISGANISSKGAGNRILLRGCQPMVWLDGMRAPGAELDDVARPGDVAGMEVYPSNAGLPPEYQDRNNRMCGAIMVWTKNQ
ncbi:MAG TPA: carboxypeptidase-like regulatory domain-containing protein [Gemmatimonadaceae bacterium]